MVIARITKGIENILPNNIIAVLAIYDFFSNLSLIIPPIIDEDRPNKIKPKPFKTEYWDLKRGKTF